jgi:hypothetical protein
MENKEVQTDEISVIPKKQKKERNGLKKILKKHFQRCLHCRLPNAKLNMGCGAYYHLECYLKLLSVIKYIGFFGVNTHCNECIRTFDKSLEHYYDKI